MLSLRNMKALRNRIVIARCMAILVFFGGLMPMSLTPTIGARVHRQLPEEKFRRVARPIANQYVVVLNDGTFDAEIASIAAEVTRTYGGSIEHLYRAALKGFSIHQMLEAAAIALSQDPRVEFVEEDGRVLPGTTQPNPPSWGLDRIDQHFLPPDNAYTYSQTGSGVKVYVIDSGIRLTHEDFAGRAFFGADFTGEGMPGNDCTGHGTFIAGIVGGTDYGVAKNTSIYNVRVLDCFGGDFSDGIAGIDWVTDHHVKPAVANISFIGDGNTALDKAVRKSIAAGVTYVVLAGNTDPNGVNANAFSPARITQAITVGATGNDLSPYYSDNRAPFSNFGSVLDIFAPGNGITSAYPFVDPPGNTIPSDVAFFVDNGTSFSTPHVIGAAAQLLQVDPLACPSGISKTITDNATTGVVINPGAGSPNLLLYIPPAWPAPTLFSLSLNGTSAYVNVVPAASSGVTLDITGPITLEAWVKLNTNMVEQSIIRKSGSTGGGYALKVMGNGKLRFIIYQSSSSSEAVTSPTSINVDGNWHHVVGVFDGTQKRLYIDGQRVKILSSTFAPATGSGNLSIGASPDGSDLLNGFVDEVRVTASAVYSGSFFNHLALKRLTGVVGTRGLWRFDSQSIKDCADIHNGTLIGGATFSTSVP